MPLAKFSPYFRKIPLPLRKLFEEACSLWDPLKKLSLFLKNDTFSQNKGVIIGEVYLDQGIIIGQGTIIEHGAMLKGPAIIGEKCQIRSGAYLRGNVFIGNNCIVGHASEIKNSILFDNSSAGHFNYLGDSILGENVNLGAGSILANLRFDKKEIIIAGKNTGLKKMGAILGDNSQLGCNTVLNPGTIFKKECLWAGRPLKSGIYNKDQLKKLAL